MCAAGLPPQGFTANRFWGAQVGRDHDTRLPPVLIDHQVRRLSERPARVIDRDPGESQVENDTWLSGFKHLFRYDFGVEIKFQLHEYKLRVVGAGPATRSRTNRGNSCGDQPADAPAQPVPFSNASKRGDTVTL